MRVHRNRKCPIDCPSLPYRVFTLDLMEAIISFTIRENGEDDDDEDVDDNAGRDSLFSLAERRGGSSLAVFRSPSLKF